MLKVNPFESAVVRISMPTAKVDMEHCIQSFAVQDIVRYIDQVHWSSESEDTYRTLDIHGRRPLENVAAHSWHVAEMCFFLSRHFQDIDRARSVELAMLHDKLEIWTGDWDPVGPKGDGSGGHIFSHGARDQKLKEEAHAIEVYLDALPEDAARLYGDAFEEMESSVTGSAEAKYVKSIDKLQALLFTLWKKGGVLSLEHLIFTLRYSFRGLQCFPGLSAHYALLHVQAVREHGKAHAVETAHLFVKLCESDIINQTEGLSEWLNDLRLLESQGAESLNFHVSSPTMAASKL